MVIIVHYPQTFSFVTDELTNPFNEETGCALRDRLMQEEMVKQNIETPYHHPLEYSVEEVSTLNFGGMQTELWGLGS